MWKIITGPRGCIGQKSAMLKMKIVLLRVFLSFAIILAIEGWSTDGNSYNQP